ncbi:hypothetical protein [Herbidospora yilanensis]|uniref:hypothetical protein n=1 Tax=Herbidospora yilanensis TaxID=354426 RepID=UPI000784B313|nr:hypothetical protein [Herbidospora yilanensis]
MIPVGDWATEATYLVRGELVVGEYPWDQLAEVPGNLAAETWPDFPRTWANPGFVVRYAHARARWARRWAGTADPDWESLPAEWRAVVRLLAELPSRGRSRKGKWKTFAEHLAARYHDAFEAANPLPRGDAAFTGASAARVATGDAVAAVLSAISAERLPERI